MKQSKRILGFTAMRINDLDPDTSYLEQEGFEDRLDQYRRDVFSFIGIRVKASVQINGTIQIIESGGLWGIESDSDESYLREVEQEELSEVKQTLASIGFSKRTIDSAIRESSAF